MRAGMCQLSVTLTLTSNFNILIVNCLMEMCHDVFLVFCMIDTSRVIYSLQNSSQE